METSSIVIHECPPAKQWLYHSGFYKKAVDGYDFLDEEFKAYGYTPYNFLHGNCDVFSAYLCSEYGYPVFNILSSNGRLIHSFCDGGTKNGRRVFIDVRGKTNSFQEFIDEFLDEIECLMYPAMSDLNIIPVTTMTVDYGCPAYKAAADIVRHFRYWV